ncbi:MAG: hypothetical protein LBU09_05030, partial [Endomicrobium sp.]|nr:hypothetical protein [Endomicrobium sp.]
IEGRSRDNIINQILWNREGSSSKEQNYGQEDVNAFLGAFGIDAKNGELVVGHSPGRIMSDGRRSDSWHGEVFANHHIIVAERNKFGFLDISEKGNKKFVSIDKDGKVAGEDKLGPQVSQTSEDASGEEDTSKDVNADEDLIPSNALPKVSDIAKEASSPNLVKRTAKRAARQVRNRKPLQFNNETKKEIKKGIKEGLSFNNFVAKIKNKNGLHVNGISRTDKQRIGKDLLKNDLGGSAYMDFDIPNGMWAQIDAQNTEEEENRLYEEFIRRNYELGVYATKTQRVKLHISAGPENAEYILNLVKPILDKYNLQFKFAMNEEGIRKYLYDEYKSNGEINTQRGKFITIYAPVGGNQILLDFALEMDAVLTREKALHPENFAASPIVPNEIQLGSSGLLSARDEEATRGTAKKNNLEKDFLSNFILEKAALYNIWKITKDLDSNNKAVMPYDEILNAIAGIDRNYLAELGILDSLEDRVKKTIIEYFEQEYGASLEIVDDNIKREIRFNLNQIEAQREKADEIDGAKNSADKSPVVLESKTPAAISDAEQSVISSLDEKAQKILTSESTPQLHPKLIEAYNAYYRQTLGDKFNPNSPFSVTQRLLARSLLNFKEILQLGMGKGKSGSIMLAGLQFLADRTGTQTRDRLIIESKGDNLALRDARNMAKLVNDDIFANYRKEVLGMKVIGVKVVDGKEIEIVEKLQIGVFTQDNKFFTIDGTTDKSGRYVRTPYKTFEDMQKATKDSIIYGTPGGVMSLRIDRRINKDSATWYSIIDEVDSAILQTPDLIVSGEKKEKDADANLAVAEVADELARFLIDQESGKKYRFEGMKKYKVTGGDVSLQSFEPQEYEHFERAKKALEKYGIVVEDANNIDIMPRTKQSQNQAVQ